MTCARTQGFLAKKKIEQQEIVDARKGKLGWAKARRLLDGMHELLALKGKRVERFDLRAGPPSEAELRRVMLGPTGNLRAPAFRVGRTLVIGFEEETYRALFG